MESLENHETRHRGRRFAEINALHQEFWRDRAKKTERQLEDEHLAEEAFIAAKEQSRLPVHYQMSYDSLLEREEERRERALIRLRQENGRRGGKCRKPDRLQELIEEIVARGPGIDCPTLLRLLRDKRGTGVIVDIGEEEISFANANDREKSAKITGLKDRLSRARKKVESRKAARASEHWIVSSSPNQGLELICHPKKYPTSSSSMFLSGTLDQIPITPEPTLSIRSAR